MKRLIAFASIFALALTVAACGGKQKKEENVVTDAPPPPAAPAIPTCGGWIVLVEAPVVTAGGFAADVLQRAFLDGLKNGGCTGVTAIPAGATAPVLKVSLKASSVGTGGTISLTATDSNTGELKWRLQEKVATNVEGTAASTGLGLKVAGELGS